MRPAAPAAMQALTDGACGPSGPFSRQLPWHLANWAAGPTRRSPTSSLGVGNAPTVHGNPGATLSTSDLVALVVGGGKVVGP